MDFAALETGLKFDDFFKVILGSSQILRPRLVEGKWLLAGPHNNNSRIPETDSEST